MEKLCLCGLSQFWTGIKAVCKFIWTFLSRGCLYWKLYVNLATEMLYFTKLTKALWGMSHGNFLNWKWCLHRGPAILAVKTDTRYNNVGEASLVSENVYHHIIARFITALNAQNTSISTHRSVECMWDYNPSSQKMNTDEPHLYSPVFQLSFLPNKYLKSFNKINCLRSYAFF